MGRLLLFSFLILNLSGCATTGKILQAYGDAMKDNSSSSQTAYCQSYNYGGGAYSVTCN
jgi:hypothetical protein